MLLQEWQAASRRSKAKGAGARRSELTAEEAFHDVRDFWQRLDADSRHQLLRVPVQGLLTRMSQSGAWCQTIPGLGPGVGRAAREAALIGQAGSRLRRMSGWHARLL